MYVQHSTPSPLIMYMPSGNFSQLWASFHLRRHMGNFMIQVYGPSVLLVVLSWVSFWLNREATSDRISLGTCAVHPSSNRNLHFKHVNG